MHLQYSLFLCKHAASVRSAPVAWTSSNAEYTTTLRIRCIFKPPQPLLSVLGNNAKCLMIYST